MHFFNKRVLFFSVQTFNLEREIKIKLEELGANVDFFDERPANNTFTKAIIRVKKNFYQHKINLYYRKILEFTKSIHYDFLFVIRGEVIPAFFLESFKVNHPQCQYIFYTWDSFKNNSHPISIINLFDRTFTFDPVDAKEYNLNLRPLFFLDKFILDNSNAIKKYDLLFLGTAHSDRYLIGESVRKWCEINNLTSFIFYFIQGRLVFIYKNLFESSFKKFDYKKLNFKSLSIETIVDYYAKSNVILDVNHFNQRGLTMRTFEAIGAKKKIITTNSEIQKYSFYNPNNIFIIDRNNIKLDLSFFESHYVNINENEYEKLTIKGWLYEIFFDNYSTKWYE